MTKFALDSSQIAKLEEWFKTKDLTEYTGAIGGRFTFSFTPTSLGDVVIVSDNLKKDEINLTDYDSL